MSVLPEEVRAYRHAEAALGPVHRATEWGLIRADPRYPQIWDANHAEVLEPSPGLTMDAILAELTPALRDAGATHEHVEFWELSVEPPALPEARDGWTARDPDVVMVYEGADVEPAAGIEVREIDRPDEEVWSWYRESRRALGGDLTDEVLQQLVERDREVVHPAGMRLFVAVVGGTMAGSASVLSLGSVAYVDNVVTLEPFRRRGVAGATVTRAVRESLAQGDRLVHLLAEEGGAPQRLYERLGFRAVSRIESVTRPLDGPARPDPRYASRPSQPDSSGSRGRSTSE